MNTSIRPKIFVRFLLSLCIVLSLPLVAQELTVEQVRDIRQDVEVTEKALLRVFQNVTTEELRKDVGIAGTANRRVGEQLDGYLSQFKDEKAELEANDLYNKGKKYPPEAKVSIESFDVPVGASEVHVPVTLDKESPNTVIAYVRVFNGQGGRANPDITKAVIFRPGDPLVKTVSFNVRSMDEGNNVKAVQPSVPDGGVRKGGGILITASKGATNEKVEGGREPLTFTPLGMPVYAVTGQSIQFDDRGGPNSFSTALSHGRTQEGNQETGYYGTVDMGGFTRTSDGLVLSSRRLDEPVKFGTPATEYPFLAAMLSGHRTPETHFKYGSIEWVVKMPNRFGSWPALWLLPTGGWPPEIDVYEGFGYNGEWRFSSDLATNLHGGDNLKRTFTRPAMRMQMDTFGLPNTIDSEFHAYAVTVDPDWITMFVDGVETMRYANPVSR
ncbi:MAG: family 16 glycosylhydrolase [Kiritimatiellae bacterium]|jgi:uncharacterized protein YdbL (DUF1318 family)|nr:family 16 glycosylhydrolase [Kiritimatiellia bacterium]